MTEPTIGKAKIEVVGDTSGMPESVRRGVDKSVGSDNIDPELKRAGDDWGETIGKSMGTRLEKEVPNVARKFEDATKKQHITEHFKVDYDFDYDHDTIQRAVHGVLTQVEDEFKSASSGGSQGPIAKIGQNVGQAFADAVGAGFNISGKSPLIILLIPLLGALGALIGAALQAVSALGAILATLPALILGIGLQVGVLFLAFKGLGGAISAAFAAKNAKELKAALVGLQPAAQEFVKDLLPLKPIFADLTKQAQQGFFSKLDPELRPLITTVKILAPYIAQIAMGLGIVAGDLAEAFSSPGFRFFAATVANSTSSWLVGFGQAIATVVTGFTNLATTAEPFLDNLGVQVNMLLTGFGDWLTRISNDPDTKTFFTDMENTVASLIGFINSASGFLTTFLDKLNAAGGQGLIDTLTNGINQLTFMLQQPAGQEALQGLVNGLKAAVIITVGLIDAFLIILFISQEMGEFFNSIPSAIGAFFSSIGNFFTKIGDVLKDFYDKLTHLGMQVGDTFDNIKNSVSSTINNAIGFVKGLPGRAIDALGNIGTTLYSAGQSLLQGFINGIKSKIGSLTSLVKSAIGAVIGFFPGSPAKEGPLSGSGYSLYRGQRMMQDFARGIALGTTSVTNASNNAMSAVTFGPGSVNANFYGSNPSESQANALGQSVGTGISGQLAARGAVLAVRTL